MTIAVYPGSFDPVSNGHLDIIQRASKIFDHIYVLVSINLNKKYIFSVEERVAMLKHATKDLPNVTVEASKSLVLEYARQKKAKVIIRGLRNFIDYQSEMTLFSFNRSMDKNIDTVIFFPSSDNLFLSSTSIKELVLFGGSIKGYVPDGLEEMIIEKIKKSAN